MTLTELISTVWNQFHFLRPSWLFAMIPVFFLIWRRSKTGSSDKAWQGVIDPALQPYVLIKQGKNISAWPKRLMALMSGIAIIAMAGPVWEQLPQPVFRNDAALVIALDLSRSMDAPDQKPSRLATARFKIIDLLSLRKEGQTALLVYAATAYTVTPLTDDNETILSQLEALSTDLMPQQGSHADQAMIKARDLLRQAGILSGDILLISDALEHEADLAMAKEMAEQGYRVSVLAMGTEEGAPIAKTGGGYITDAAGNIVLPILDESALRAVAQAGAGYYQKSTLDDQDVIHLAKALNKTVVDGQVLAEDINTDKWQEEGPYLLLLLLPFAAYGFRRGYLLILLSCGVSLYSPPEVIAAELWKRADQQAQDLFDQGESRQAAELFKDPRWKASAQYKAGDYESALNSWQAIEETQSQDTETLYNKANAQAKLGRLEEAIESYEQVLDQQPKHDDAAHNLEQVKKALEEQQQESEQDQGDQEQGDQDQEGEQDSQGEDQQDSSSDQSEKGEQGEQDGSSEQGDQGGGEPSSSNGEQDQQTASNPEDEQLGYQDEEQQQDQAEANSKEQQAEQNQNEPQAEGKEQAQQEADQEEKSQAQSAQQQQATQDETEQAVEAALRAIPDDPGGLLRRKFLYQYRQQGAGQANEEQAW